MNTTLLPAAVLAAIVFGGAAQAASVTLAGTIRDFNASHPDFESTIGGLQSGQVADALGADGKPVWQGPARSGFTTEANFDQWYNDVEGVNMAQAFDLVLSETPSGTLRYSSNAFFPIDGMLLGNEGRTHNYHFTLELHGQFAFEDGDSFTFTGDDDLWVFFGGSLGIDLGGVHASQSKTITSADLEGLGLSAGTNYALDIFFAERHTTQSNFTIETSFSVAPPPVPLPASLPMIAGALGGLGLFARRRSRR